MYYHVIQTFILTKFFREKKIKIVTNEDNVESSKAVQRYKVIIHEDYNNKTYDNDIALIYLPTAINTNVSIVPLAAENMNYGNNQLVLGWGSFNKSVGVEKDLQYKKVKIITKEECDLEINSSKFCAISSDGVCMGDSGGPLFVENVLVGITSAGDKNCNISMPTYYTNISYQLTWIKEKIEQESKQKFYKVHILIPKIIRM